jgi:hypothetical protein
MQSTSAIVINAVAKKPIMNAIGGHPRSAFNQYSDIRPIHLIAPDESQHNSREAKARSDIKDVYKYIKKYIQSIRMRIQL